MSTTVEPPNKGPVGDNINSAVVPFVEKLSSSRRFKMYYDYREANVWDLDLCPCREVFYIVSLSRRVHYRRFHCIYNLSN